MRDTSSESWIVRQTGRMSIIFLPNLINIIVIILFTCAAVSHDSTGTKTGSFSMTRVSFAWIVTFGIGINQNHNIWSQNHTWLFTFNKSIREWGGESPFQWQGNPSPWRGLGSPLSGCYSPETQTLFDILNTTQIYVGKGHPEKPSVKKANVNLICFGIIKGLWICLPCWDLTPAHCLSWFCSR